MDTLLIVKWQWPNGGSFWSTHADIGVDGRIRDWPGLKLTPVWARRLELGAGDTNLLAVIRKAGGDLLSGASDLSEFDLAETEAWVVEPSENGVDLPQSGNLIGDGLSHDAVSAFLVAENGRAEQLANRATRYGQGLCARVSELESALRSQLIVTTRLARHIGFSDRDLADCTSQARTALNPHVGNL